MTEEQIIRKLQKSPKSMESIREYNEGEKEIKILKEQLSELNKLQETLVGMRKQIES